MTHLFIFGLGYTASRIAARMKQHGWRVDATGSASTLAFEDGALVEAALANASHILSSVPPDRKTGADPVLQTYGHTLSNRWLGYLSSTGVYGDTGGAWVDESAPVGRGRREARSQCDVAWMERGARVFRLPGIYGPGRSAFERIASGKARMIDLPGQVFSRIHVEDIASAVEATMLRNAPAGAYNIADDLPTTQSAVIEEACRLLGIKPPPLLALEEADLSEMARGFYMENRRVANGKAKRLLGWRPNFPTYREGLASCSSPRRDVARPLGRP